MIQLVTKWGKNLRKDQILQEYPRPMLVRDSYLNLNGEWDCCINHEKTTDTYEEKILVPFSPETLLSGVGKIVQPGDFLHYRKVFRLPEGFLKKRLLLHFGAVDQECEVFLNGILVGTHKGGYLPFSFDITEVLRPGDNELKLTVTDWTEEVPHARGKQKLVKKGRYSSLFYTPQSGIWKTVWLESVEEQYIESIRITPLFDQQEVEVSVSLAENEHGKSNDGGIRETAAAAADGIENDTAGRKTGESENRKGGGNIGEGNVMFRFTVYDRGKAVAEAAALPGQTVRIKLPDMHPWTPDDPYLYELLTEAGEDIVSSYFGMRKLSVDRDSHGILRFFLNNRPFFFNGVLDQGYWPESLLTAPSDEALIYDIVRLKELGYNTIRKHIKVEPERFYYHCDRLGMIVWQDMPNGGGDYDMNFVTDKPNASDEFARSVKDGAEQYAMFRREDAEGRQQYYEDLSGMVSALYNYPSIAVWTPFNEGWGQFDAAKATALIRSQDGTRLINEACGWFDQGGGDMYSIHNYSEGLTVAPQQDRVVALTEFGGYAWAVEGHVACEKAFGYQSWTSREELTDAYRRLWEREIYPNVEKGLSAAIYTQTTDIEEEINGVMTYDREVGKFEEEELRRLNRKLYDLFSGVTL